MIKPNIKSVMENEGIVLIQRGNKHVAHCPFHSEKTPSFMIFDDHYHCFGCGTHGDGIDFVRELHGLSFPEALEYLGIENELLSKREYQKKIKAHRIEQQEKEKQLHREVQITEYLVTMVRATKQAAKAIKTINDFEKYGQILEPVTLWEHYLSCLSSDSAEVRKCICKKFKEMEFEPIQRLWNSDFNYREWLNNLLRNGENDAGSNRIEVSFS